MSAPVIGITSGNFMGIKLDIDLVVSPRTYTEAVIRAGGIPLLIPVNFPEDKLSELLNRVDGLIFTGGGDIDLSNFEGEEHEKIYGLDHERDKIELSLMEKVADTEIPFLAICRGMQIMNVFFGGTLFTHILDQKEGALDHSHQKDIPTDYKSHSVQLVEGTKLKNIFGKSELEVNSLHHQGIRLSSSDLKISAVSSDDLVEGLELDNHPFGIGVQWHPEWMPEDEDQQRLFGALILATQKRTID